MLLREVVESLVVSADGTYIDGTVGTGGHSLAIGQKLSDRGLLICLDRDPDAVRLSGRRLAFLGDRIQVIRANYAELDLVLKDLNLGEVDGVFLDLGMSTHQLEKSGRGFSFGRDEPLDMRMDPEEERTARDIVNNLSWEELEGLLKDYGEEKKAKSIAKAIVGARRQNPIVTSSQLAALVQSTFPLTHRRGARHPATRTFQALRIEVNKELENLQVFLKKVPFLLKRGGRLVILSYHSLEDRLVKQAIAEGERACVCPKDFPQCACGRVPVFRRLLKKGVKPSRREIAENPRARSAVLRAAERV